MKQIDGIAAALTHDLESSNNTWWQVLRIILAFGGVLAISKMSTPGMVESFLGFVIDTADMTVAVAKENDKDPKLATDPFSRPSNAHQGAITILGNGGVHMSNIPKIPLICW